MNEHRENLLDYLKKPSGYMTIVVLVLTIIATFIITLHFQDKREIKVQESQYNFLTRNNKDDSDINQHIKVYYDGKEIYDPYVIKITISNTGNQYISESDFISDNIKISFSPNTILYDVSVSNATPMNIEDEIKSKIAIEDNCLLISPFLLNVDESFTLSIITNQETEIFYNFRIEGIRNIKRASKSINIMGVVPLFLVFILTEIFIELFFELFRRWKAQKRMLFLCIFIVLFIITASYLFAYLTEAEKSVHQFIFK